MEFIKHYHSECSALGLNWTGPSFTVANNVDEEHNAIICKINVHRVILLSHTRHSTPLPRTLPNTALSVENTNNVVGCDLVALVMLGMGVFIMAICIATLRFIIIFGHPY